jgi:hypothetical protein
MDGKAWKEDEPKVRRPAWTYSVCCRGLLTDSPDLVDIGQSPVD